MAQSQSRYSRGLATLLLFAAGFSLLGEDTGTEIIDAITVPKWRQDRTGIVVRLRSSQ